MPTIDPMLNAACNRQPPDPPDVVEVANRYLALNAAESGADVLIKDLVDEVNRLRSVVGALHRELGME